MLTGAVSCPGVDRPRSCLAVCYGALSFFLVLVSLVAVPAMAQGVASAPRAPTSSVKPSGSAAAVKIAKSVKFASRPAWQELTPAQQLSLKPLAANWRNMPEAEKRKWIALAANYSTLTPPEQAKMHSRMTEWSALSLQQRTLARLNFARSKQISPTQKAATWQAYQALSPEDKKKLATSAPQKPKGAAIATRPVPQQQLVKVPVPRQTRKTASNATAVAPALDQNTLLPHARPASAPVPAPKN
jgi:hypothetical protein